MHISESTPLFIQSLDHDTLETVFANFTLNQLAEQRKVNSVFKATITPLFRRALAQVNAHMNQLHGENWLRHFPRKAEQDVFSYLYDVFSYRYIELGNTPINQFLKQDLQAEYIKDRDERFNQFKKYIWRDNWHPDPTNLAFLLAQCPSHEQLVSQIAAATLPILTQGVLCDAVSCKYWEIIRPLTAQGISINESASQGTPLISAVRTDCANMVSFLLHWGADPSKMDICGVTPLIVAIARSKDKTTVEILLEAGADVRAPLRRPFSLLHRAVGRENLDFVKLLLAKGADPNARDKDKTTIEEYSPILSPCGDTPLHWAVRKRNHAIAEALLAKGANPYLPNDEGNSAFSIAENGFFENKELPLHFRKQSCLIS